LSKLVKKELKTVMQDIPEDKDVHVILDNYCTHKKNDDC
jgi:transposase